MARSNFQSVDEYISIFPDEIQKRLQLIRKLIKENVPDDAEETISYQIPTFKLNGKFIIYFAGFKNHTSIYPIPPGPKDFKKDISEYIKGRGTLQFSNKKDLPIDLIKEVIKYSLEANLERTKTY